MANWKKLASGAAGAAGGAGLNVEDVFSTYLYDGNGSTQTITNGIDFSGEGGMLWIKARNAANNHTIFDTERAITQILSSNQTTITTNSTGWGLTSFNSDGFSLNATSMQAVNNSGNENCSWSFRKAPKFFDVVTYTGNSTANRAIPHSLGQAPGFVLVKCISDTQEWVAWHKDYSGNSYHQIFNNTQAEGNANLFSTTAPTDTNFYLGNSYYEYYNQTGRTYVMYLFAHNDGDGEFGPNGDQDIIKCGSYTGNGSTDGPKITLGFEPQFIMVKRTDSTSNWRMYDVMRGLSHNDAEILNANSSAAESNYGGISPFLPLADGFKNNYNDGPENASGGNYVYIAIRRGPMAVSNDVDDLFNVKTFTGTDTSAVTNAAAGFPVDFAFEKENYTSSSNWYVSSRLTAGKSMYFWGTAAEASENQIWDSMTGVSLSDQGNSYNRVYWMWKRSPNFFDAVAYTGDGATTRDIDHNLGVAPEMIWIKGRGQTDDWYVYAAPIYGDDNYDILRLNSANAADRTNSVTFPSAPTASVFTVYQFANLLNGSGNTYIAYLFASLNGISKVGSYTGNGSSTARTIDCGFSNGAKFVLIKRTDTTGNWFLFDTARGITSGDDKLLQLNKTNGEASGQYIDPVSSGFATRTTDGNVNANGGEYIFYAIAAP